MAESGDIVLIDGCLRTPEGDVEGISGGENGMECEKDAAGF